jgi:hypothetical protein
MNLRDLNPGSHVSEAPLTLAQAIDRQASKQETPEARAARSAAHSPAHPAAHPAARLGAQLDAQLESAAHSDDSTEAALTFISERLAGPRSEVATEPQIIEIRVLAPRRLSRRLSTAGGSSSSEGEDETGVAEAAQRESLHTLRIDVRYFVRGRIAELRGALRVALDECTLPELRAYAKGESLTLWFGKRGDARGVRVTSGTSLTAVLEATHIWATLPEKRTTRARTLAPAHVRKKPNPLVMDFNY